MKPKLFTKRFWTKKRTIIAASMAGVALASIVIAVPVAVLTKPSTGPSQSVTEPAGTDPVADTGPVPANVITKTNESVIDITYGTSLDELAKIPPPQDGYGAPFLLKAKTSYTPEKEAGAKNVAAVFEYSSLTTNDKLWLSIPIEVQKAPLTYIQTQKIDSGVSWIGTAETFTHYDLADIDVPDGWELESQKVEYSLPGLGVKVDSLEQVIGMASGTVIAANYELKPDKNHYGSDGLVQINYTYKQKEAVNKPISVLPGIRVVATQLPNDNPAIEPPSGYFLKGTEYHVEERENNVFKGVKSIQFSEIAGQQAGTAIQKVLIFERIAGYDAEFDNFYIYTPYWIVASANDTAIQNTHLPIPYGKGVQIQKPAKFDNYSEWTEPEFKLLKPVSATADNYVVEYGTADKQLTPEDLPELPANTVYQAKMTAISQTNKSQLEYVIEFTVVPVKLELAKKVINVPYESEFGQTVNPPTDLVIDSRLGSKAVFELYNPRWKIGLEGVGEIAPFVKGYSFNHETETAALPPGTVVYAEFSAKSATLNLDPTTEQKVLVAVKVKNSVPNDRTLEITYDQDASSLSVPAAPANRKPGALENRLTTYQKGYVPGQISSVVFKYESTLFGRNSEYAAYQLKIKPQELSAGIDSSINDPKPWVYGSAPEASTEAELNLSEQWVLADKPAKYKKGGINGEEISASQVARLTRKYNFTALYEIVPKQPQYVAKKDSGPFYKAVYHEVITSYASLVKFMDQRGVYDESGVMGEWKEPTVPNPGDEWTLQKTHYTFLKYDGLYYGFSPEYEQVTMKDKIKQLQTDDPILGYILEGVWQYINKNNEILLIVIPFKSTNSNEYYYRDIVSGTNRNRYYASLDLTYGTRYEFFTTITGITDNSAPAGGQNALPTTAWQDNTYTPKLLSNSGLLIMLKEENGIKREFTRLVTQKYLAGETKQGRNQVIEKTALPNLKPSKNLPERFWSENGNDKTYSFFYGEVVSQKNPWSGKYAQGKRFTATQVSELPTGTTFKIVWTAAGVNPNQTLIPTELLIDFYTIY